MVTKEIIETAITEAIKSGAVVVGVPVKDTIKVVSEGLVLETPNRQKLWVIQTPQVFRFDIIDRAYRQSVDEVTDDASLVEKLGHKVRIYMGSYDNIKVTTPEDLAWVTLLLRNRTDHTGQNI